MRPVTVPNAMLELLVRKPAHLCRAWQGRRGRGAQHQQWTWVCPFAAGQQAYKAQHWRMGAGGSLYRRAGENCMPLAAEGSRTCLLSNSQPLPCMTESYAVCPPCPCTEKPCSDCKEAKAERLGLSMIMHVDFLQETCIIVPRAKCCFDIGRWVQEFPP